MTNDTVLAGQTVNNTIIDGPGSQTVYSGGIANGTLIVYGTQTIDTGGIATKTTINGTALHSSFQVVYGEAIDTTINSFGTQWVFSGGSTTNTIINVGGKQEIGSNSTAMNTTINGGIQVVGVGATATNTTIDHDGLMDLYGAVSGTITFGGSGGGILRVEAPAFGDTIFGASLTHISVGDAIDIGGMYDKAAHVTMTGGWLTVSDGFESLKFALVAPQATYFIVAYDGAAGTLVTAALAASIVPISAVKSESNSGATPLTFTVSLSQADSVSHTVDWAVSGSGAHPANAADFGGTLPSGTVTFAPGETSKTITVGVSGDTTVEPDEGFTVTLGNPSSGLTIGTGSTFGTILNDDTSVASIVATDAVKAESNNGTTPFTFTVTLDQAAAVTQTVNWSVAGSGDHPANGTDFVGGIPPSGTATFAPGETSKTISVGVSGDRTVEFDEFFIVTLSNPSVGLVLGTATAVGDIQNDDRANISIAPLSATKVEGNSGITPFTFTVSLDQASTFTQTADWTVVGSGANPANAADFGGTLPSGTVTFAPGETSKTITVGVSGDTTVELDEGFTVTLGNPSSGLTIGTGSATGTIQNDDSLPAVTAHNDAYIVLPRHVFTVTAADSVLLNDDNATTATLFVPPSHGSLQFKTDGSFVYTPAADFAGIDAFLYHSSNSKSSFDAQAYLFVVPSKGTTSPTLDLLALTAPEQIGAIYTAFFGRAPDAAGFKFWVNQFNLGLTQQSGPSALFADISSAFGVSDEAKTLYPFLANPHGASDAQISGFLDTVYNNLFNRSSDAAGLAYWTGQIKQTIASGKFVGSVLVDIISGTQVGPDVQTLSGKVAVGLLLERQQEAHNTQWNGAADNAATAALLHAVSSDPQTVLVGIKQADLLIAAHA